MRRAIRSERKQGKEMVYLSLPSRSLFLTVTHTRQLQALPFTRIPASPRKPPTQHVRRRE